MAWTDYYVDLSDGGSGDGSTGDPFATLEEACADLETAWGGTTATGPTRIFVRGSYTLGAQQVMDLVGSGANPILWIGCTGTGATWTRIGNDASAAKPTVTTSTYNVSVTGNYQCFEGIVFTGAPGSNATTVSCTSDYLTFVRCRIKNTSTGSGSAFTASAYEALLACHVEAAHANNTYAISLTGANSIVFGCVAVGGKTGCIRLAGTNDIAVNNICRSTVSTSVGIYATTGPAWAINNTIYAVGEDGIEQTSTSRLIAINNLIHGGSSSDTDYPIRNSNATASHAHIVAFNAWYNVANNTLSGLVEAQNPHAGADADYGNQVFNYGLLGGDPLPNAASLGAADDFDLSATYKALAFPGTFEAGDQAYVGYMDHGAVQRVEPTSSGGGRAVIIGG